MKPQFDSIGAFFAMGGDAFFVWMAWGISVATILALIIYLRARRAIANAELAKLQAIVAQAVGGIDA